jgi:hypothetical protein
MSCESKVKEKKMKEAGVCHWFKELDSERKGKGGGKEGNYMGVTDVLG